MGDLLHFTRAPAYVRPIPKAGFSVKVIPSADGEWLVVSRQHSWDFRSRKAAQAFAHEIAEGFGVGVIVRIGGAA
jgi:hypothetical protein